MPPACATASQRQLPRGSAFTNTSPFFRSSWSAVTCKLLDSSSWRRRRTSRRRPPESGAWHPSPLRTCRARRCWSGGCRKCCRCRSCCRCRRTVAMLTSLQRHAQRFGGDHGHLRALAGADLGAAGDALHAAVGVDDHLAGGRVGAGAVAAGVRGEADAVKDAGPHLLGPRRVPLLSSSRCVPRPR